MGHKKELIEHLSSEITTHATNLMTFRSRFAFTVLIGPFVVMGSFLVATRGEFNPDAINAFDVWTILVVLAALGACAACFGLCHYGAMIDARIMKQCNEWRGLLVRLADGDDTKVIIEFQHRAIRAYWWGFFLVFVAFLCVGYIIWAMFPVEPPPLAPHVIEWPMTGK